MKLRELVYDVITRVNEFSDDSDFTERYIEELINQSRANFLSRDFKKKRNLPLDARQTITAPLELVNSSLNTSVIETNRFIVRTSVKIPNVLEMGSKPGVYTITSMDRNLGEFDIMDKARAKYYMDAPFCPSIIYLDTDERMYIVSSDQAIRNMTNIGIDFIAEDPREAIKYSYPDMDIQAALELDDYPIGKKLWKYVKDDVVNQLLGNKFTPADIQQASAEMQGNPMSQGGTQEYLTSTRAGF